MDYNITCKPDLICRTCLSFNSTMKSIFEDNIAKILKDCQFANISVDDSLPNKICSKCRTLTLECYNFKQQCQAAEAKIKQLICNADNLVKNKSLDDKFFICDVCQESFPRISDLILHKDSHKSDSFACPYCLLKYEDSQCLINHLENSGNFCGAGIVSRKAEEQHRSKRILSENESESADDGVGPMEDLASFLTSDPPPPFNFTCRHCSDSFEVEHDLKLHESTHTKIAGTYNCLKCKKKFRSRKMLQRHIKTHMINKPHVCKVCHKGFAESHALTKHFKIHSGEPTEKKHFCAKCGQGFVEPFYLKVHMRKHTGERPLKCTTCDKTFADPRSFKSHELTHTGERSHKCNICDKKFYQRVNLKKHMRVHTGEKPYVCAQCGKCFAQTSTLERHSRIHSGQKPYECTHCAKRFNEKWALTAHIKTHTGDRPYACELCGKRYIGKYALKVHKRRKRCGIRKNVCHVCDKEFMRPSALRRHLRFNHRDKSYPCLTCDKQFESESAWNKHFRGDDICSNRPENQVQDIKEELNEQVKNETPIVTTCTNLE